MAEQVKTKPTRPGREEQHEATAGDGQLTKKGRELKESIDNLLDEIDDLLEENAEEFVSSYVQRGGE
jgi:ubiquitin-like protein Pup